MLVPEALSLLGQVCANYKGTLKEHQSLQEALSVVNTKCSDKKEKEES